MTKNTTGLKAWSIGIVLYALYLTTINALNTQYIAGRLAYHAALGDPLFANIYQPFSWWRWMWHFYEGAKGLYHSAFVFFVLAGVLVGTLTLVIAVGFISRSARKIENLHGSAHFATMEEIATTGLMSSSGVYCGAVSDPKTGRTLYLRHDGPEHVSALAPTRSGKGVGLVVPTLLSWPASVFVLDRKGENFAMTSGWRREYANNKILRFDPANPIGSCSWNALAEIRHHTRFQVSDTQNIALMVVDDDGKGISGDHFRTAAYELLVGLILHALYKGEQADIGRVPCLQDCAHMLTGVGCFAAPETQNDLDSDEPESDPKALAGLFAEMKDARFEGQGIDEADKEAQLVINGVGRRMASTPARELGSIISTANNALSLYRDPIVGENTKHCDFKVADLMDVDPSCEHSQPVSLYFITTPRNADRMRPLMRLMLTVMISTLADEMTFDKGRSKTNHEHRLLLMLDEFPTLGKLELFESALAFIAGYGMKAYLISQDIAQLRKHYGPNESITSNCHVRVAYAPNLIETAEWMSRMSGTATISEESVSTSGKRFGLLLDQVSRSWQNVQRPLMTADEIMRLAGPKKDESGEKILEAGEMLVFVAGNPVIRGRQILYFLDPIFSKRSMIEPPSPDQLVEDRIRPRVEQGATDIREGEPIIESRSVFKVS